MALWSGLGYYARARHLRGAARRVCDDHGGELPTAIAALIDLPGIGRSTAGAILSLALDQRHPILDGNVKRVLARAFGVEGWPGQGRVLDRLWSLAEGLTPAARVGAYNQGMMDLGATLCVRRAPACERCPVSGRCVARRTARQAELPTPRPRRSLPERTTQMLILYDPNDAVLLERRPGHGIWGGLWSLPEIASADDPADWCERRLGARPARLEIVGTRRHSFSHFTLEIEIRVLFVDTAQAGVAEMDDRCWVPRSDLSRYGMPAPVKAILDAVDATRSGPHGETR
jgi:A/G-specific adenine glycosylase